MFIHIPVLLNIRGVAQSCPANMAIIKSVVRSSVINLILKTLSGRKACWISQMCHKYNLIYNQPNTFPNELIVSPIFVVVVVGFAVFFLSYRSFLWFVRISVGQMVVILTHISFYTVNSGTVYSPTSPPSPSSSSLPLKTLELISYSN